MSLTQPAVTILLKELEEKLGVRLFDRTTRALRRTTAALEAIAYAERVLGELDALSASMTDLADVRRGRLRVAATSTVAQTLLPKVVRRFLDLHPGVKLSVDDCAPAMFAEHVLSEQVDLGVGTLESAVPGLEQHQFLGDHLCAVATDAAFGHGRPMTWKQLSGLPVIVVQAGYGVRRSIERAAQQAGVELQVAFEVSLLTTALAMAASGLGVAVVPQSILAHTHYTNLVARRLVRPVVLRSTSVVFKEARALSPSAQAFAELLRREFSSPA
ncbi:Cyn operon transcriptional activator [Bordetella bronchiseptica]|nr:LysR substrate-binding domain protein [Bordetella bronchiseptica MBORD782]VTQ93974.1 Cyn operon transcriptional activator [Bordetella bronchiseptica]